MERIKIPYGLEGFRMEAHGDDDNALLDTEGGQWSVAIVDSIPEHADIKDPAPWSSLALASYLAELHNQNVDAVAPAVTPTAEAVVRECANQVHLLYTSSEDYARRTHCPMNVYDTIKRALEASAHLDAAPGVGLPNGTPDVNDGDAVRWAILNIPVLGGYDRTWPEPGRYIEKLSDFYSDEDIVALFATAPAQPDTLIRDALESTVRALGSIQVEDDAASVKTLAKGLQLNLQHTLAAAPGKREGA